MRIEPAESGAAIVNGKERNETMTHAEHVKAILAHVFDDGTGTEITPYIYNGYQIIARAYHPRYGLLIAGYDPDGDWFSNQTLEDLDRYLELVKMAKRSQLTRDNWRDMQAVHRFDLNNKFKKGSKC